MEEPTLSQDRPFDFFGQCQIHFSSYTSSRVSVGVRLEVAIWSKEQEKDLSQLPPAYEKSRALPQPRLLPLVVRSLGCSKGFHVHYFPLVGVQERRRSLAMAPQQLSHQLKNVIFISGNFLDT